ncbi:DUF4421 domain-containing protein [Seonamhaeicola sediminis]|uniref:DUF4421 domain-containing protein n=1 Tax=Seonamhaeicola sediminis TaxID=2528206 RepID=A0A562YH77_9FLAO|nr:DUF4421 family protein [Seonamhaeicola sediminis]TWO33918.1 DUF4421 domain-containing protein [Seonamhaeicola sediminis]
MDIKAYILNVILFCASLSFSQNDSIVKNQYITQFQDKISTRLSIINTSNSFYINDSDLGLKYQLKPNVRDYFGASILFRSVEIDYGFSPKFLKSNRDNANSKLFNLNLRMFQSQWMQTIDLYNQKGFDLILNNERVRISGIKTFKIGGSTSYILNKKFSFRAIGFQNEWQTKSAGSFIPRLYYYYTKYTLNDNGFNEDTRSYDVAIGPSYYYNLSIHKNFLFSVGASAGIGINHSSIIGDGSLTSALYEFSGRAVIGYNSETFFGGINYSLLILEHNVDRYTRQDDTIPYLEFYIGYRFKASKKIMKLADDFNRKFGF